MTAFCITVKWEKAYIWTKHRQLRYKNLHLKVWFACVIYHTHVVCMCVRNTTPLLKESNHAEENARVEGSRDLILLSNDVKYAPH